jgi:outer membrane protein TolC
VGPTVSYTLDYTGGIARSIEQQQAQAEAARQQLDAAFLSVSGQAVMQAITIASLRAQIATVETILEQDRDNLRLVRTAFENGSVARIDVVSAESQIASDSALLPPLRQSSPRPITRCRSCWDACRRRSCPRICSSRRSRCRSRYR